MRPRRRIPVMLWHLGRLWWRRPDWRLTQLVVNVANRNDPFYVEDADFLAEMKEWA